MGIAWISSDYFDSKQSDEFQARLGIDENNKMSERDSSNEQVILTTVGYDHVIKLCQAHIMTH